MTDLQTQLEGSTGPFKVLEVPLTGDVTSVIVVSPSGTYSVQEVRPGQRLRIPASYSFRFPVRTGTGVPVEDEDEGSDSLSPPVSALTLTDIAANNLFQRVEGGTTMAVPLSGTYTGGDPVNVQAQVLLAADDSVVVDWTNISGATIGGGTWSGTITTPEGGPYYAKARPSDAPELVQTGTTTWSVGDIFLFYGQSNNVGLFTVGDAPPATSEGTWYIKMNDNDGPGWQTAEDAGISGNGVREFLNTVRAALGVPVGAICRSIIGAPSDYHASTEPPPAHEGVGGGLWKYGQALDYFGITNGRGLVVHQGEGDVSGGAGYHFNNWLEIHDWFLTRFGRTAAQFPMVVSSLGTFGGGDEGGSDEGWLTVRIDQHELGDEPNVYYSHSNMDAVRTDVYHFDAASQQRSGARYAHTVLHAMGVTGYEELPHWEIAGAETIDATTTDVTVTHSLGTDFTPTTGITGFDVSGDNGGTWEAATGARVNGTTIRLTHSALATSSLRKLRYQYGRLPDVSGCVLDNSSLAAPLCYTRAEMSPTPLASLPVPTFMRADVLTGSSNVQTLTDESIGASGTRRMVIFALGGPAGSAWNPNPVMTITPDAGEAVVATRIGTAFNQDALNGAVIFYAVLGEDSVTATTIDVSFDYGGPPFGGTRFSLWTVNVAELNSTTPTGTDTDESADGTVLTLTVNTSEGGFVIAASGSTTGSQSVTWTGDETYSERVDQSLIAFSAADASDVTANAASEIVVTFGNTAAIHAVAAAWR